MPYKADGSDVPENVSVLSAKKRRQWAGVWNSVYEKCIADKGKPSECETAAFKQANGVVKEEENMAGFIAHEPAFEAVRDIDLNIAELTFETYRESYYARTGAKQPKTAYSFAKAPKAMIEWIGQHFLLVNDQGVKFAEMFALPVVDPDTCSLNATMFASAAARAGQLEGVSDAERDKLELVLEILGSEFEDENTTSVSEIEGSVSDFYWRIRQAFIEAFAPDTKWTENSSPTLRVQDLLYEDSVSGNMLVVLDKVISQHYGVSYMVDGANVEFAAVADWKPVVNQWGVVGGDPSDIGDEDETMEHFAELDAPIIRLVEEQSPANRRSPLTLEVAIIKVGPGNKRDKHFYTKPLLERDGHVFEGVTMHVVDHREDQRSERTDVSTVKKVTGVTEMADGEYLLAEVLAYDPDFCEKTRNRADAGLLDKLQCSILAMGEAKKEERGGMTYNVVQRITEARHVDWVTRAGAGGHALTLAESDPPPDEDEEEVQEDANDTTAAVLEEEAAQQETPDAEMLEALDVVRIVEEVAPHFPATSLYALLEGQYADEAEVREVLAVEIERLKSAGSGAPVAFGGETDSTEKQVTQAELSAQLDSVNAKYLGG